MPNQPTDSRALDNGDVYLQQAPFQRNEERLVSEALSVAAIPGDVLAAQVRPPMDIIPFPPRFGYPSYQERQATLGQVLNEQRNYRNRRYDISGGPADIQASARNAGGTTI